jgi:hypothetical protein
VRALEVPAILREQLGVLRSQSGALRRLPCCVLGSHAGSLLLRMPVLRDPIGSYAESVSLHLHGKTRCPAKIIAGADGCTDLPELTPSACLCHIDGFDRSTPETGSKQAEALASGPARGPVGG